MGTILVVDDSGFQRKIISSCLKKEGYKVIEAKNGFEGLEKASGSLPDLLILDLLMPEMDGFTVLEKVREMALPVPILVLTSDIQSITRQISMQLGAAAFINKPVRCEELLGSVHTILGR